MGISHRLAETMAAMKLSKVGILKDRAVKKKVWTDFSRLVVASKILLTLLRVREQDHFTDEGLGPVSPPICDHRKQPEGSEQKARAMLSQHRAVLDDVETTRPTPRT